MFGPGRILITGGAGFIGSHLARRCVADGHDVHLLLRPSSDVSRITDLLSRVHVHRVCLSDRPAIQHCLAAIEPARIFHLAYGTGQRHDTAIASARALSGATEDLLTLVEATAILPVPPRAFIRVGSIAEYGDVQPPFREDQRECPRTGYAAAITACTHHAGAIAEGLPFPLVTARLALVYGPGQASDFLVPSLVESLAAGKPVTLRRPLDRRDLIHVYDAVDALCRLATTPPAGGSIVNIGSGRSVGVGELAEWIAGHLDVDPSLIRRSPQADPVTLQLSVDRMHALLGRTAMISLEAGIGSLWADAQRAQAVSAA